MASLADVRARLDDVIAAMRANGVWDVAAPPPSDPRKLGAFGMAAMAFEQWLRWVFVPNVEALIASDGPWPARSEVAVMAVREGDTNPVVAELVPALAAFDALFSSQSPLELAKELDAAGQLARACAAYCAVIERGDSPDDAFARDRRLQLEMQLLLRREPVPPAPATARADSAAFAIVQATAARLPTAHAFMIRPTQCAAGRVMPAVIGTVVAGRALGHCIVGDATRTLAREGDRIVLADGDHLLDWVAGGVDPAVLTVIDAAMYLFDRLRTEGAWWWEVSDRLLAVRGPHGIDVAVSPRDGGGVVLGVADEQFEAKAPQELLEIAPIVEAAIGFHASATR